MGYGISMNSGFGTLQIDSDNPLSYLKVTAKNTGPSIANVSADKMVCIRPPTGGNDPNFSYGALRTGTGPYTYNFYKNGAVAPNTTSVDYVVLEPVKLAIATTGYGLQVYNSENELAFDTGIFISGGIGENIVSLVTTFPPGTALSGNTTLDASILYTGGDYTSIYGCINPSVYSGGVAYNGFRWATDNTIRFNNYLNWSTGFSSGTYYATNSFVSIVLLKVV